MMKNLQLPKEGLIWMCMLIILAGTASAQDWASTNVALARYSAQDQNDLISLEKMLDQIGTKFKVNFGYESRILKNKTVVPKALEGVELESILHEILEPNQLQFQKIEQNYFVIIPEATRLKEVKSKPKTNQLPRSNNLKLRSIRKIDQFLINARQAKTVTGKVIDYDNSESLPGVNVVVKGTSVGTVTDLDGNYSIEVPGPQTTLVFSSVGYTTEEILVGARSVINLNMTPDIQQLQELVVVGYGTQKKQDVTGAISSIDSKALESLPANTFEQALQGTMPGVQVRQGNAAPGGGMSIRIRGSNSITGNSEPLYVIDGVPLNNSNGAATVGGVGGEGGTRNDQNALATLNPNDIASIEVLKDASATAIYGSRGANGVVIITTKSGKAGKPKVQFDVYGGIQEPTRKLDLLNAEQFATRLREHYDNAGEPRPFDDAELDQLVANGIYDYQDELFRSPSEAAIQNYQLSVSGASEDALKYYASLGVFSQDGIIKNSGFDRYSLRLNLDKTFGKFRFGNNVTFSRTNTSIVPSDGQSSVASSAITRQPIIPAIDEDGNYTYESIEGDPQTNNPIAIINGSNDQLLTDRILGSVFAEYEFIEGLRFRSTFGVDIDNRFRKVYYDRTTGPRFGGTAQPGLAQQAESKAFQWVSTNTLTYQRRFAEKHSINLTGVFEAQAYERNSFSIVNRGFPSDALGADAIASGQQEGGPNIGNGRFRWQLASWVGRAFYSFDDKYLITVTGRYDGSSRFGANNRWGFFPSAALGWRISEEPFMENFTAVDELKLRGSYGVTGNQEIGILQTAERLNPTGGAVFGGIIVPTVRVQSFANEDLKWEETNQFNLGVTSSFLNSRITFSADYYVKNTIDLLLNVNLPISAGFSSRPAYNLGELKNQGVEIALGVQPIASNDLTWNLDFNFTRNRNEVISIFSDRIFGPEISAGRKTPGNLVEEGRPAGVFYGYQTAGVYADQQEVDSDIPNDIYLQEPGEYKYVDVNNDGVIDIDDRTQIGDPNPDFIYGMNSSLSFKNFTLDLTFQGSQGNDIFWYESLALSQDEGTNNSLLEIFQNRWTPENTNAEYPKYNNNATGLNSFYDSRMIHDGSFFRLRNIVLSYNLPVDDLNLNAISNLRIYGSVANAFTITNYPGYNPDVNSFGQNPINQGIDLGGYPLPRTYTLGVNLTF